MLQFASISLWCLYMDIYLKDNDASSSDPRKVISQLPQSLIVQQILKFEKVTIHVLQHQFCNVAAENRT